MIRNIIVLGVLATISSASASEILPGNPGVEDVKYYAVLQDLRQESPVIEALEGCFRNESPLSSAECDEFIQRCYQPVHDYVVWKTESHEKLNSLSSIVQTMSYLEEDHRFSRDQNDEEYLNSLSVHIESMSNLHWQAYIFQNKVSELEREMREKNCL